jgi:uncharacterized membrane protein YccC
MSAEASVRRLLRRTWQGVAEIARSRAAPEPAAFAALLVDRLGLLAPKLAGGGERQDQTGEAALADLRVAMNLVVVQGARPQIDRPAAERLEAVSAGVEAHFARLARDGRRTPDARLLTAVDSALEAVGAPADDAHRAVSAGLVGLRRNLFPTAPAFVPGGAA